jgi:TolA-binding protein
MITYIALLLSVIAVFIAWSANKKYKDLKERLAQTNSRVYHLRREIEEKQEAAHKAQLQLKFELLKLSGGLEITPEMRIEEVVAAHPQAQQILTGFHLGGCSSCSIDDNQTLGEAVAVNGRELEPVLVALNALVAENGSGNGTLSSEQIKTPNVQIHF